MDDTWQSADYRRLSVCGLDPAIAGAMAMDFHPLGAEEKGVGLAIYFEGRIDPLLVARLKAAGASVAEEAVRSWDWFRGMREAFRGIRPFSDLLVRPPWEEATASGMEIVIEPGAAFGTGLHATTQAMLAFMKDRLEPGMTFLDVGAGSGILSIYAAKIGGLALALENDRLAVGNLLSNRALNPEGSLRIVCGEPACLAGASSKTFLSAAPGRSGTFHRAGPAECKRSQTQEGRGDRRSPFFSTGWLPLHETAVGEGRAGSFDIVAANLTFPVHRRIAPDLDRLTARPGFLLLAGIVSAELKEAKRFASSLGRVDAVSEMDGWVALSVERR